MAKILPLPAPASALSFGWMAHPPSVRTDLPTGTVTFLFTDVGGSTRLLHELGARYAALTLEEALELARAPVD